MPDITGPPVTLDGSALQGAEITVIHNDTGAVLGETTTDADGNWSITVTGGQTVHVLAEYEADDGTLHQEHSRPFVVVESVPATISAPTAPATTSAPIPSIETTTEIPALVDAPTAPVTATTPIPSIETTTEIPALVDAPTAPSTATTPVPSIETTTADYIGDPVSFWPIDEGSGTTVRDDIGSRDGTNNGGDWLSGVGYGDYVMEFNGGDIHIDLGTWATPTTNGAFTVLCWARFDDPTGGSQPFAGHNTQGWQFHKSGSGDNVYCQYHGSDSTEMIPAADLTQGWHMCAVTRATDDTARGYYDDQGLQEENVGAWTTEPVSVSRQLGSAVEWTTSHDGAIDYFLLYDYELTEQEIIDVYNQTAANYPGH